MSKKPVFIADLDPSPAPQFSTAASIESGLSDFLEKICSCCGGTFSLTCARAAERQAQTALDAVTKKRKTAGDQPTGLIATTLNAATQKTESVSVTVSMIEAWLKAYSALSAMYQSISVILAYIVKVGTLNTEILNNRATARAEIMTAATMALHSPSTKYSYETYPLVARYKCRTVTEADRDFLYTHLRKNGAGGSELLYWVSDKEATVIPRDEKWGTIPQGDTDFWEVFYQTNDTKISQILRDIEAIAYQYETDKPTASDGLPEISFDERLMAFVPQCLLRHAVLTRRTRTEIIDGKAVSKFDCYMVECSTGGTDRSSCREKWREALSKSLLYELSIEDVPYVPQFSNVPGEGLSCIPLAGDGWSVDRLGLAGKKRAEEGDTAPELPSEFKRFFYGDNGEFCLFESDPKMSLLRLANFLYRVLVAGTSCRQCLVLGGSGKDGKSILIKIIFTALGLEERTIDAAKLDSPTHTYNALNAPLVAMPEVAIPSIVFSHSFFKSLTGGDTIPMKKMYSMPFDWRPEHTRLMMTTNNLCSVGGDAQVSRLLPIACQKAYNPRTARQEEEIVASCLTQRVEFLQWVCDTVAYYKALKTPSGDSLGLFMPDRLMVVSDSDFDEIMEGHLNLLDASERERRGIERRAIEGTGNNRFAVRFGEDASDDEAEWYECLFNAIFEYDPDSKIKRAEVAKALMNAIEPDPITHQAKSMDAKFAADALGIKTAHILWDKGFKGFKEWMISEGKAQHINAHNVHYFKGLKVKILSNNSGLDDQF